MNAEIWRWIPDAPQALLDALDIGRGVLEAPVRSEIFGPQRFAQHGRSLGLTHRAEVSRKRLETFSPRVLDNIRVLREAHRYIGQQAVGGYDISPAAEWLLDNFHLIEAQLPAVREGLPRDYYRRLPVLLDEPLSGLPRVYGIAWAYVAHTDSAFNVESLVNFLLAYQETRELKLRELWALPTTLRVVLIENLRRVAERIATSKAARELANVCCDRIDTYSIFTLNRLLRHLNSRGVGRDFLGQIAQRFQDQRTMTTSVVGQSKYVSWLHEMLPDSAAVLVQLPADQAANNLTVSNAVTSLRAIGDANWMDIVIRTNPAIQRLLDVPLFKAEHPTTQDRTLHQIERIATRSGKSEIAVVEALLKLMSARLDTDPASTIPAYWTEAEGRPGLYAALGIPAWRSLPWSRWLRKALFPIYVVVLSIATYMLASWAISFAPEAGRAWLTILSLILLFLPVSETAVAIVSRLISESAQPTVLPRLAFLQGIPAEHRTLVAIPAMLTDETSIRTLTRRLYLHHLANPECNVQFALLTDWRDSEKKCEADDAAVLSIAIEQLKELNQRHELAEASRADVAAATLSQNPSRFILLHRQRRYSQSEQRWIGWERKRGKLEMLIDAIAQAANSVGGTDASPHFLDLGALSRITLGVEYVVTLDSDTEMPPGRLRDLVGVAAHPQNQPELNSTGTRVVSGYGILQPRIATPLPSRRERTGYHWLFAGQGGIDPYSSASSEVYQDFFAEGSFTGKGLLNVRAMHRVLSKRLPEGQVLSHDLLEGALARCAALSDITLIEDAPFHADVAASRVHRWIRGDWQLLPILLVSLFRPSSFRFGGVNRWKLFDNMRRSLVAPASLVIVVLAIAGVGTAPIVALGFAFAAFCAGPVMGAIAAFVPSRDDVSKQYFLTRASTDLVRALLGGVWLTAMLLQHALRSADAIMRALYRTFVSRRNLLQWTTAAIAQTQVSTSLLSLGRKHVFTTWVALALLPTIVLLDRSSLLLAIVLCAMWGLAPVWIWVVSSRGIVGKHAEISVDDHAYLRVLARDTWRFFERTVGEEDNHLPPDNLQTLPHDLIAHRTSPTNIGLYLLSCACAKQFGWISTDELLSRLDATLRTLKRLQRYRGHFLNWYDTLTCAPLHPMYVSTVDSGNLSGHLLTVAQSCAAFALCVEERISGDFEAGVSTAAQARQIQRLRDLARDLEELAWEADYRFLYDTKRSLFHIGFRLAEQQLDSGYYDLLASESRLTSLLAIAKGDVPAQHWAALGRPFFATGTRAALRSWSGSMFEYLMPTLVLAEPDGSVLADANLAAIHEQVAYGRSHHVPWGISESAYAARDELLVYQYAPQGVPGLALRRTPPNELVIAPYATALAAQLCPNDAIRNFCDLEAVVPHGEYGFIDAIDFSVSRQEQQVKSQLFTPVSTYMAHHQGMTLVAIANVLFDGVVQRWAIANAYIEAVSSLLHERAPRELSLLHREVSDAALQSTPRRAPGLLRQVPPVSDGLNPTHLLSNGRYRVTLRANGAGSSSWGQIGILRSRDDALRDMRGHFLYARWVKVKSPEQRDVKSAVDAIANVPLRSITLRPSGDPAAVYSCTYHADRVCFDTSWPAVRTHMTAWVSPEDDIEFRQVEITNTTDDAIDFEIASAFEITLAPPRADEAHPAFSNLFIEASWQGDCQAIVFKRKPRLTDEPGAHLGHFVAESDCNIVSISGQVDRSRWLARNGDVAAPNADLDVLQARHWDSTLENGGEPGSFYPSKHRVLNTGLDPVCVLAATVRIAPMAKARITFATAVANDASTLGALIDKYRQANQVERSSLMSATLSGIRLRALRISPEKLASIQTLTTLLLQSMQRPPVAGATVAEADSLVSDRSVLWRVGVSGDRPIILVLASSTDSVGLIRAVSQAMSLWAWGGVECDLIILNAEPTSYLMALHNEIALLRERFAASDADRHANISVTGFHVLRVEDVSPELLSTLQRLARVTLRADGRSFQHQVKDWNGWYERTHERRRSVRSTLVTRHRPVSQQRANEADAHIASKGQFATKSGEFAFDVNSMIRPKKPWVNVLSNPLFGAQLSESGGGFSWAINSRLNQLTAWSNDAVADPPGEWFLLEDVRRGTLWSVSASCVGTCPVVTYNVTHGQGFTVIRHRLGDLEVCATWIVEAQTSAKHVRVELTNHSDTPMHIRLIGFVEWMMGQTRADRNTISTCAQHEVFDEFQEAEPAVMSHQMQSMLALFATQNERSAGFGGGTAFLSVVSASNDRVSSPRKQDWTCDRSECFDDNGQLIMPDRFRQQSGERLDPCAAISVHALIAPGQCSTTTFTIGYANDLHSARELAFACARKSTAAVKQEIDTQWHSLLSATTVSTPDPLFNVLVNRWFLYQAVTCRLWAKAGFYQAGGATGFRDQLQDAMALTWAAPERLRQQIILCSSRQFVEGDIQHWWHMPSGAGVRTHFSDDLLWLPFACLHYLKATNDVKVLDEFVPYLDSPLVPLDVEDVYEAPNVTHTETTVFEHCARTIDRSLPVGVHGLPLIGGGDWNDGMNRVGHLGRGESVWLGWFLCEIIPGFCELARARGEDARADEWNRAVTALRSALTGAGWDGHWFKRAFFDNGDALGSHLNAEAQIDLIAQAWSVLSDAAPIEMQHAAMAAVHEKLVDSDMGLIRLLDTPLNEAEPSAGYIQAYPPGVRENGGQYSHGGVWAIMAVAKLAVERPDDVALSDRVYEYFTYLSAAHRAQNAKWGGRYGIEPYVMAGDVCTQPPYVGVGGWSWYTGAAGWMHRAAIESIFGMKMTATELYFTPCLPSHWPRATLTLKRGELTLHFIFLRTKADDITKQSDFETGKLLQRTERLQWTAIVGDATFFVPLI